MKTLWIIDHYSSEPKRGGISRHYDFAEELAHRGYRVVVISSSYSHFTHEFIHEDDCKIVKINDKAYYVYLRTIPYKDSRIKRLPEVK